MGYPMKLGSKEKNTPSNFNEKNAKRMSESFNFAPADMEVEITASTQKTTRGEGAPTAGSSNVDKVVERKKKRVFGQYDPYLTPKEKMGKKGAKWAKQREFSKQKVSFKTKK
jgi:hypothetical protein